MLFYKKSQSIMKIITAIQHYSKPENISNYLQWYSQIGNPCEFFVMEIIHRINASPNFFKDKTFLDLGIGTGLSTQPFVDYMPFKNVIALDGSKEMVEVSSSEIKKSHPNISLQTLVHDLEKPGIPLESESVDFIMCAAVINYIENYENVIKEANRILKPKGLFAIMTDLHTINSTKSQKEIFKDIIHYTHSCKRFEKLIKPSFNQIFSLDGLVTINKMAKNCLLQKR